MIKLVGKKIVNSKEHCNDEITADEIRAAFGAGPGDFSKVIITPSITDNLVEKSQDVPVVVWDLKTYTIKSILSPEK